MDVQSITQVNKKWIFSEGGQIRDKASPETLRAIYADAVQNARFYERMRRELSEIIDREREKLQTRRCPTVEEIEKLPFGKNIDAKLQREYYLRDVNKISGMYDALSEITQKHWRCEKIARQARAALEG